LHSQTERSSRIYSRSSISKLIMKRYLLYLKNQNFRPSDAPAVLLEARRSIPKSGNIIIRDVRVAQRFMEFDVSVSEQEVLDRIVNNALSPIGEFDSYEIIKEEDFTREVAIEKARDLFNNERFWKCHEVLENIWKQSEGEERRLLNGVILVAAAFVHFQKGEDETCIGILRRAHDKIKSAKSEYYKIKFDLLEENLTKIIDTGKIIPMRI
jgi:predicted metal-dependent hydrolase